MYKTIDIQIWPAALEEKPEIWQLFVAAMKPYIDEIWGWQEDWQTNEFNSRFFKLNTSFLIAEGEKLGYVQYSEKEDYSYLNTLILKPNYQGKSLGGKVLGLIQGLQPNKPLKLRCFQINSRALSFYQKSGFSILESDENFVILQRG